MAGITNSSSHRKKEHLELCLTDKVSFIEKTTGFERYDFEHFALTEVDIKKISFSSDFYGKIIKFPFLISCMTGGVKESENINAQLAIAAEELNIPIGVGSQRHALENNDIHNSFKIIRKNAPNVPVLGNIGAAQIVQSKNIDKIKFLVDIIKADAMVIHVNASQELFQKEGEPNFKGLLKQIEKIVRKIGVPIIVKEVGAGISGKAAKLLLDIGVKGIDVAGAGGTSWTGIEMLRNKKSTDDYFWDWGLPTSYCIKDVNHLRKKYSFILIGSGGINNPVDAAKAYALGADMTASARYILQQLDKNGISGIKKMIEEWFAVIAKIMFLTGSQKISDLRKKIVQKENLY